MAELQQQGIGRVRGSATAPVAGSAFLISARHVMTCAHVVNAACGRPWPWASPERPDEHVTVLVEFPFARRGTALAAQVVEWRPPGEGVATDIAVLELEREVSERPYRTVAGLPQRGQAFWTKGFPAGQDAGMDAAGELGTPIEHGRLLAHGSALPGFFIEGGFSGAPLLDETSNAVIGMAAAAARDEGKRTGFVIPADQLEQAWPLLAQPYKGLFTFREEDRRFFFGRDSYIEELADKLRRMPFVAVLGRSGSGKSSLVRAGLLPRLHEEGGWRVLVLRPGAPSADPFRNLAVSLLDAARVPGFGLGAVLDEKAVAELATGLGNNPALLAEHLHRLAGDGPDARSLLLVVDQFEELFTLVSDPHPDDESGVRARFVQCLRAAVDTTHTREPAARCIVTLRADYLGRALSIRPLADLLKDADIKLGPMNAAELRAAIEEPARSLGVRFEDGLVDELMQSVGASLDALPLLEFALAELWSQQRDRLIRRPELPAEERAAEVLVAPLTRHAEAVFADLSHRFGEATFRAAITALVWLGDPSREGEDTRRLRRKSEFTTAREDGARQWELLEQLASQDQRARLVTLGASRADGEPTAEIVHEALIRRWQRLRDWLDEDRGFRLWLQKTEAEAAEWHRSQDASDLLTGRRLAEAQRWHDEKRAQHLLTVADYIVASQRLRSEQEYQERQRQRHHIEALQQSATLARRWTKAAAIAAMLAVLAATVAAIEWQQTSAALDEAQRQAVEASSQRDKALRAQVIQLATAAEKEIGGGDAVTGMLLALEALHIVPESASRGFTAEAESALTHGMQQQREIGALLGHTGSVLSVTFSPDGKRLASASGDQSVRLWDVESGQQIGPPLLGHTGLVYSVAFSPDGKRLASASDDKSVRLWDTESGRQIGEPLLGHTDWVLSVSFSPDGKRLATASSDKSVRLWDAETGRQIGEPLLGHTSVVYSVVFSPNGRRLASASGDQSVRLWDAASGLQIGEPLLGHTSAVVSVAFAPDGKRLATASSDKSVRLWDAETGQQIGAPLLGHTGAVVSVAFSPDGERLATGASDASVRLWDPENGRQIGPPLLGHTSWVRSVAFSPDGNLLASASGDQSVWLWDPKSAQQIGAPLLGHTGEVYSVAFSRDGRRLASASDDRTVRLWDTESGRQIGEPLLGHTDWILSLAFAPDGKRLATASSDKSVRLWDAERGRQIGTPLLGHTGVVYAVVFSPDGKRLASGSADNSVRLWDVETARQIGEPLLGHTSAVVSVAFSPNGKRLASASGDKSVRLWDVETGRQIGAPLLGHTGVVYSVTFSPDGKRLATGSFDTSVRLWDAESGQQIDALMLGHTDWVLSVAFSPHGKRLASASADQSVRLWDTESGRQIDAPLFGHTASVNSVVFSPDGKRLATGSSDKVARLWPIFASRAEAIQAAVSRLPRCLSPYQKTIYGLAKAVGSNVPDNHPTKPPCW